MMMTPEVHTSKVEPSFTAFLMPSGIETRYWISVSHSPSEIDTGSFSAMRLSTERSRK